MDAKEDSFLLNNIEKTENKEYKVEILEYILDFSAGDEILEDEVAIDEVLEDEIATDEVTIDEGNEAEYDVLIENLDGEVIDKVKNTDSTTYITEIVKNNIDRFNKKELIIKRNDNDNLEIVSVKSK